MRSLAHIERITNIRPIDGADRIEAIDILGWTVVSEKGIHKVGDLVVYFEIDSWLDSEDPRYDSFSARFGNWEGRRGMRLKTIKLKKQISQGLIMSLKHYPEIKNPTEGRDVTELLKIVQWERAETGGSSGPGGNGAGREFPHFIFKTDQERVQNEVGRLSQHIGETFEKTIKLDGSSMTVYHVTNDSKYFAAALSLKSKKRRRENFVMKFINDLLQRFQKKPNFVQATCSRNHQISDDNGSQFMQVVTVEKLYEKLESYGVSMAIQGELVSPSIQKNYEKVWGAQFFVYDIFDIDNQHYLTPNHVRSICKDLGLNHVPVLDEYASLPNPEKQEWPVSFGDEFKVAAQAAANKSRVMSILQDAEGPGMNPGVQREGVVWKSNSTQFSFKAISDAYLLKEAKAAD